jgi:steroid delta-isomerase-like uncharacterized protein
LAYRIGREKRMSAEEHKAIVRRWMAEAIDRQNLAIIDELFAPDHVTHLPGLPEPVRGNEGEKELTRMFHAGFPDGRLAIEELLAEGDMVAARLTFHGTHTGAFQGIPPTGKRIAMQGMGIARVAGGKIVELWQMPDMLGLMQQLGVVPAPGQT